MKNKKGFTLIELLVVIAIIGLLSTLAVVSLNSARGKARDAQRISDVKQISTAIEMHYASQGTYIVCTEYGTAAVPANENVDTIFSDCTRQDVDHFDLSEDAQGELDDPDITALAVECVDDATPCNYTITYMDTDLYEICFHLENGSGNFSGLCSVGIAGIISNSCTYEGVPAP